MDTATADLLDQYADLLSAACQLGQAQLERVGLDAQLLPATAEYRFAHQLDPFTQQPTLNGHWGVAGSQRRASLVINADGSLLLECDLLCEHPRYAGRWAEQISIWGRRPEDLKAEISLLAQLED